MTAEARPHWWQNGFLLLLPLVAWGVAIDSRLPMSAMGDASRVAPWIAASDRMLTLAMFLGAALLWTKRDTQVERVGSLLWGSGALAYMISTAGLLILPAPPEALVLVMWASPLVFVVGVGLMADSIAYLLLSALFGSAHLYYGLLAIGRM
jgi:hypothetical protein